LDTVPGKQPSPTSYRGATRSWFWKMASSAATGARLRLALASKSNSSMAIGGARETRDQDAQVLLVDLPRLIGRRSVIAQLDRRDSASDANLHAAAAQIVQHADLFDETQRVIEREQIDQRPDAQSPRAWNDRGEEHAW